MPGFQYPKGSSIGSAQQANPALYEGYGDGASPGPQTDAMGYGGDEGVQYDKSDEGKNTGFETTEEGADAWSLPSGYEAGEPYDFTFDIPEYVTQIRDELNLVRDAKSKIYNQMYSIDAGQMSRPDPIECMRMDAACDALDKEETRLMLMLQDAQWVLPPLMEAPHNMPTQEKARMMLHEGTANGKPLNKAQRGLFGIIASGKKPRIKGK